MLKENELNIGDTHTSTLVEDLKRTQIVQYAGASGDYNPLHTDEVFTTQIAGYPSVFAHGMLSMGLTGTMLTNYVGDGALKKYGVRFTNQVWPGDTLKSTTTITAIRDQDGERVIDLEIVTTNQNDVAVVTGNATAKIES
ncbi:MAG TPA: acyl dehydratase [Gammaproteobacteria bacterium]|jgi:acyl dehydratase|nr:acyl dehydratase [Gammaproteobacteria bacterium]HIK71973.1 acyl dehydratase [Gammaproteobacteria bacterium]